MSFDASQPFNALPVLPLTVELAELIFAQPYCPIGNVVEAGIAQRQSASTYLKALASIGVLEEHKAGLERLFINPE